ncbi:peptidoglycan editing factor PgeF [Calidifontibacillus erzurumensis]|uniref:Purine nucleoside phosphorylase n=1 Tax=Calidifontibacillus erzurumensis TaxID=2741433 RepID=A0A8J8KAV8_9BACI|nr:peptidoglycan editing factor PgeF [Calidifontibacillus erzurumensis]NSL51264.1 peptidoglycan editing factor PgeF [Calidifontibacillus erzurumensis]
MIKEPFFLKHSVLMIETWSAFQEGLIAGFSTRQGGFSTAPFDTLNLGLHVDDHIEDVLKNRKQLASMIRAPLEKWVCGEQIHSNKIAKVTKADGGKGSSQMETAIPGVDGLYTKDENVFLMAAFADCVPIYFFAKKHRMIGIAHAGWRGTVANISGEMIKKWTQEENIPIEDICVCIGPSIGKCCYEVDEGIIKQIVEHFGSNKNHQVYEEVGDGKYHLDLKQANYELLKKSGVNCEQIEVSSFCTSCHPDLFFSHRRDKGKTGRMLGFIGLTK